MTATKVRRGPRHSTGGKRSGPHVSDVAHKLAPMLGCSPKAAQNRLDRCHELLCHLPIAAAQANKLDWLDFWSAQFDALRAEGGDPVPWSIDNLRAAKVFDRDEDLRAMVFTIERSPAAFKAWFDSLGKQIRSDTELYASAARILELRGAAA
jgi:hypothetical protein